MKLLLDENLSLLWGQPPKALKRFASHPLLRERLQI